MIMSDSGLAFRRAARAAAGASVSCPVEIVPGNAAPELQGDKYHWTNKRGELVRFPLAYARKGWSGLQYVASTLRVVVGQDWQPSKGV